MAVIRPFRAVRPIEAVAHLVASVPYDVVSTEEAAELAKDNPINFLRVTRSEIELTKKTDPYSDAVYEKARENFKRIREEAPLIQEEKPSFYVYRLKWKEHVQTGIAATFSTEDYENDVILKHEKTRRVKEDDRTNHIITTEAQTGAVFLTYKGVDEINNVVEKTVTGSEPLYHFDAGDGVEHTIWIIDPDFADVIQFEMSKVKNLYIADGHHRAASASRAQKVMKEKNSGHTGEEEYNFFLAVLFPAEQLKILPYNRIVYSLKGIDGGQFISIISKYFNVYDTEISIPPGKGKFCMYINSKWYMLSPNENVVRGETYGDKLDVSLLQQFILKPFLDIEDPRTDDNIDFIGGIRGTEELEKLVDSGKAAIAFSMYPVEIEDLMEISNAGETMPPKSTWFEPKLRDGLLVHLI
jgi:uncharacterized protein (DUF1015 family)